MKRLHDRKTVRVGVSFFLGLLLCSSVGVLPLIAAELSLRYPPLLSLHRSVRPLEKSAKPRLFKDGQIEALRIPCNFAAGASRAGCDFNIRLDLRASRGIRFMVRCANDSPVSYFAFYFKSGKGWYKSEFSPRVTGRWESVEILKADTTIEGQPEGWGHIEQLRISAWRKDAVNTAFDIAGIGDLPANRQLVVVRGLSAVSEPIDGEDRNIFERARNVVKLLDHYSINATLLEDIDVTTSVLSQAKVVILPYNPEMPVAMGEKLADFVEHGGAVIGFYLISAQLQELVGVHYVGYRKAADIAGGLGGFRVSADKLPGAPRMVHQNSWNINLFNLDAPHAEAIAFWVNQSGETTAYPAIIRGRQSLWMTHVLLNTEDAAGGRLLLAMVSSFMPEVLRTAAYTGLLRMGRGLPYHSLPDAYARLQVATASYPIGTLAFNQARQARGAAIDAFRANDHLAALDLAIVGDKYLREAFYRVQRPLTDEFRGAWCHRGVGIDGWSWERSVRHLKNCGFTAIMPNMMNASTAWYPSTVLRSAPEVTTRGDLMAECLAAAQRYGLECHVWKMCFRLDSRPDPGFVQELAANGRFQVRFDGSTDRQWLCPANRENRQLELAAIGELVSRYAINGIQLDYIRYPGADYCFCDSCRDGFERSLGRRVRDWPRDIRSDARLMSAWQAYRRQVITSFVRDVRALVKRLKPGMAVSAAVFGNATTAGQSVAQDWPEWCRQGYVDFVCPMDYFPDSATLDEHVAAQQSIARQYGVPVYPGLGATVHSLDAVDLINQINISRRYRTGGFAVFEYTQNTGLNLFPHLAKGLTAETGE